MGVVVCDQLTFSLKIMVVVVVVVVLVNPETRKYWVDVQRGIVSSHEERDPL